MWSAERYRIECRGDTVRIAGTHTATHMQLEQGKQPQGGDMLDTVECREVPCGIEGGSVWRARGYMRSAGRYPVECR